MKTYIITGGTGFVGNNLVKKLLLDGNNVVVLARNKAKFDKTIGRFDTELTKNLAVHYGSITCTIDLKMLFSLAADNFSAQSCDIIFIHTASVVYLGSNKQTLANMHHSNTVATKYITDLCVQNKCRLVYVSSVHAIPEGKKGFIIKEITQFNPKMVRGGYAKSKAIASQTVLDAVKDKGLDAVLVHPSGIAGPNDGSTTHMTQMVQDYKNGRIPMGVKGGYDFVDVRDVADGIAAAAVTGKTGNAYILANKFYTVSEILDCLHGLGQGKRIRRTVPMWVAKLGLPFLSLQAKIANKRPLYSRYSLYALGANSIFCIEKAKSELGYSPRCIKDTLKDMVESDKV